MNRRCGSSKSTPTPLNGLAMKPGKTRRKVIEGDVDTIRRQTIRQNLPRTASVAGGRDDKALWQDQPPSKPSRASSAWQGGRDKERRIEVEHWREDKVNHSQNPSAGYHRGGGARQKLKTNTKSKGGKTHSPAREVPSRKLKSKIENKTTCIKKERRQNVQSCATM